MHALRGGSGKRAGIFRVFVNSDRTVSRARRCTRLPVPEAQNMEQRHFRKNVLAAGAGITPS